MPLFQPAVSLDPSELIAQLRTVNPPLGPAASPLERIAALAQEAQAGQTVAAPTLGSRALAVGKNSIPGIAAMIAGHYIQQSANQAQGALGQEAESGDWAFRSQRALNDARRVAAGLAPLPHEGASPSTVSGGGGTNPVALTSNPTQQAALAGAGQSWDQPTAKPDGMQMMAHLDAQIAAKGLTPFKQKILRAKCASRLVNQVGADPLAVGMWVQGGSTAFEELAKQQTQLDVAGVRAEGRTKPLTLQDKMDLIQKKSDADAQRARQKSLEDIYAKGVMPKFGKWFDTPEKFTSAFKKQFPDFVTPGATPQPAQGAGAALGSDKETKKAMIRASNPGKTDQELAPLFTKYGLQ